MEHLMTFNDWRAQLADSPGDVLAGFRERLSGIDSLEAETAIAYLPEEAEIPDTPDIPGSTDLLNLLNSGEGWSSLPLAGVPFLVKDLYDVAADFTFIDLKPFCHDVSLLSVCVFSKSYLLGEYIITIVIKPFYSSNQKLQSLPLPPRHRPQ